MRNYLGVVVLALAISRVGSKDAKKPRNGNSIAQKVFKSKLERNGTISFLRHPSPVVSELTPVLEPNLYNPLSGVDRRKTQCKEIPPQFSLCYDIGYKKYVKTCILFHELGRLVLWLYITIRILESESSINCSDSSLAVRDDLFRIKIIRPLLSPRAILSTCMVVSKLSSPRGTFESSIPVPETWV